MAATGSEVKVGVKKATVWGTAVAVGANNGILATAINIPKQRSVEADDSASQAFVLTADRGNTTVTGDLTAFARYDGLTTLFAMAMGTAGAPVQQGATAAYKHTLALASNTDGKFVSLAVDKVTQIHEFPGVKVRGFTLRGEAGQPMTVTFACDANDRVAPATVNTSFGSLTYRDLGNRVLFNQCAIWLNDQSGGALSASDKIQPASFELSFQRRLKGEWLAGNAGLIDEPVNDGMPEIRLSLVFPRYVASTFVAALQADTRKKASIVFTGSLIASTFYYTMGLYFPHLVVEESTEPIDGAKKIPNNVTLRCLQAAAAPTGMSYTLPLTMELINLQTSDSLA